MIFRLTTLLISACISFPLLSFGQEPVKPPLNPRIVTATKQVTMFSALEKQMLDAVQKKDKAALKAMLADEAIIHLPDADPLTGDDWVDAVMSRDFNLKSFMIRQMDVVDLGTAAVVSYDRIQDSTFKSQEDGGEFYVVEQWQKNGDSWKLANRYVCKVGSVPVLPKGPVRPTGKQ
jgi:ketosteroid isomerase-like protein